jgi:hypothetical protein
MPFHLCVQRNLLIKRGVLFFCFAPKHKRSETTTMSRYCSELFEEQIYPGLMSGGY